jgi:hypothetical protein
MRIAEPAGEFRAVPAYRMMYSSRGTPETTWSRAVVAAILGPPLWAAKDGPEHTRALKGEIRE